MKTKQSVLSIAALVFSAGAFAGGDALVGEQKAQVCAACHGTIGISKYEQTSAPIIAGQYADYLLRALKDYKSGVRDNAIMKGMVASLSERDMQDIAAYFSQQDGLGSPEIK